MSIYPKDKYVIGQACAITLCNRKLKTPVKCKGELPGTVIVVHGVNDVGVSFEKVESGLCDGLKSRIDHPSLQAGKYRIPKDDDKGKLLEDPDAVFFKRQITEDTYSPVIPFYWGYRAPKGGYRRGEHNPHGQATDTYGNRLDKDYSKGGGPFANATTTLPDMWRRGFSSLPRDILDQGLKDPLRPMMNAPGRMYMVLAAKRLAALISMIRDWDANETVSIVAHSQGCMLSLLAQAFLLQDGLAPADNLILTHPPYSLVEDVPWENDAADMFNGGEDAAMRNRYDHVSAQQTLHARLQTLVNLVQGVAQRQGIGPELSTLKQPALFKGQVGACWEATNDRDNRGKVYLYFCPEDRTVALSNVQGIGWQGVPDYHMGSEVKPTLMVGRKDPEPPTTEPSPSNRAQHYLRGQRRRPLKELGPRFLQRVFTGKKRPDVVKVGAAPHDFVLRRPEEDENAHVGPGLQDGAKWRAESYARALGEIPSDSEAGRRGLRRITGEALPQAVPADMLAGSQTWVGPPSGKDEEVDPIDAAIGITSRYGFQEKWQLIDDPRSRAGQLSGQAFMDSPHPGLHKEKVNTSHDRNAEVQALLNQGKEHRQDHCQVLGVWACLSSEKYPSPWVQVHKLRLNGKLLVLRRETPNEARLRWQNSISERSYHGAIFGSRLNHANVTAYDIAIGQGKAPSHPDFYAYLCAVADWRLKRPIDDRDRLRPGILSWQEFLDLHGKYYNAEPKWRKNLIKDSCEYYSTGELPASLPVLPQGLPPTVVCQTMSGMSIRPATNPPAPQLDKEKASTAPVVSAASTPLGKGSAA